MSNSNVPDTSKSNSKKNNCKSNHNRQYNRFTNSKSNIAFNNKMNNTKHNNQNNNTKHNNQNNNGYPLYNNYHPPYNYTPNRYIHPQDSIIIELSNELKQMKYKMYALEQSSKTNYERLNTQTSILSNIQKTLDSIYHGNIELQVRLKMLEEKFSQPNPRRPPKRKTNNCQKNNNANDIKIPNNVFDFPNGETTTITFAPITSLSDLFINNDQNNKRQRNGYSNVTHNDDISPQMSIINEMIKKVSGISNNEKSNNSSVHLKLPDMNKDIHTDITTNELNDFVELDMKNLEAVLAQGRKFIELESEYKQQQESKNEEKETKTETNNDSKTNGSQALLNFLLKKDKKHSEKKKNKNTITTDTDGLYKFLDKRYSINPKKLINLVKPIELLNSMIGMSNVKKNIYQFISHFLQNERNHGMLNTAIYGKPGVGKTDLGKILCMIYSALEIVPSSRFTLVKASELIGKYVGETRQKTKKVIEEANGGVLFIDEAYSLTSGSGRDTSYGKECIDTLNQELSENRSNLVVIIAGYENDIKQQFFAINPGLARRFPFRYVLNEYTKDEMKDIFLRMLRLQDNLYLSSDIQNNDIKELFTDMDYFSNCGGDIENLITQIEFANNKRSLGKHPNIKGVFIKDDLIKGLEQYKAHKKKKENNMWQSMYM